MLQRAHEKIVTTNLYLAAAHFLLYYFFPLYTKTLLRISGKLRFVIAFPDRSGYYVVVNKMAGTNWSLGGWGVSSPPRQQTQEVPPDSPRTQQSAAKLEWPLFSTPAISTLQVTGYEIYNSTPVSIAPIANSFN